MLKNSHNSMLLSFKLDLTRQACDSSAMGHIFNIFISINSDIESGSSPFYKFPTFKNLLQYIPSENCGDSFLFSRRKLLELYFKDLHTQKFTSLK